MSLLAVGFAWDLGAPFSELFPGFPLLLSGLTYPLYFVNVVVF